MVTSDREKENTIVCLTYRTSDLCEYSIFKYTVFCIIVLNNCTLLYHKVDKAMATHSSVLAWSIPGTEEPVGLPSVGSHRVGHD